MRSMFGWSLPTGCTNRDIEEAYGVSAPITVLNRSSHIAKIKQHICAECFSPIHIGERYTCTVYKDGDTQKITQFKTHIVCPYDEVWP